MRPWCVREGVGRGPPDRGTRRVASGARPSGTGSPWLVLEARRFIRTHPHLLHRPVYRERDTHSRVVP